MFDTMKVVKFVGGFGGALLIFLLVNMVANKLYFGGGEHGGGEEQLAYAIKCKSCHKLEDGKNATGPHLYSVVGRPVAGVEGFKYSDALKGKDRRSRESDRLSRHDP